MQLRRSCPIDWALLPPLSLSHWGDRERLSPLSLGPAPPQSECNCGGAAPLIGLYSHRCPTRTGATERGSRPSPSAGRLPSARATAAESCTFVVLYSHRRRSRTGPTPMYLEDVGATPHLDHRSHKSIRSATPVEPSISRLPSPAPKSSYVATLISRMWAPPHTSTTVHRRVSVPPPPPPPSSQAYLDRPRRPRRAGQGTLVDDSVGKVTFRPPNQERAGPPSDFAQPMNSAFFEYLFPT